MTALLGNLVISKCGWLFLYFVAHQTMATAKASSSYELHVRYLDALFIYCMMVAYIAKLTDVLPEVHKKRL